MPKFHYCDRRSPRGRGCPGIALLGVVVGLTLPCICGLGAASDAYTVPYHGIDAAGGLAAAGDYAVVGALGGVGGLRVGRPDEAALRAGFPGQLNEPPTTAIDTLPGFLGEEARVAFATLLANDHDPEADALALVLVTSPTLAGAVVRIEGHTIVYTPPTGSSDDDTFGYVVMDAFGATASGTANYHVVVRLPIAGADAVQCVAGRTTKFPATTLLANDTVDITRTASITAVASASANGATLMLDEGMVFYIPANSDVGTDSFTYTLSDGVTTATGTVTVTVEAVPPTQTRNIKSAALTGAPDNPQVNIEAAGIPGRRYRLQMTAHLTAPIPWSNLGEAQTAPADGQLSFTDPAPESPRFYRMIEIP